MKRQNLKPPVEGAGDLTVRLHELKQAHPRARFTLERGRGETYSNSLPTLYGHWPYDRWSVLAGQECRAFVEQWTGWDEARAALAQVRREWPAFRYDDLGDVGSTHVPIDRVLDAAGLPHDEDY